LRRSSKAFSEGSTAWTGGGSIFSEKGCARYGDYWGFRWREQKSQRRRKIIGFGEGKGAFAAGKVSHHNNCVGGRDTLQLKGTRRVKDPGKGHHPREEKAAAAELTHSKKRPRRPFSEKKGSRHSKRGSQPLRDQASSHPI